MSCVHDQPPPLCKPLQVEAGSQEVVAAAIDGLVALPLGARQHYLGETRKHLGHAHCGSVLQEYVEAPSLALGISSRQMRSLAMFPSCMPSCLPSFLHACLHSFMHAITSYSLSFMHMPSQATATLAMIIRAPQSRLVLLTNCGCPPPTLRAGRIWPAVARIRDAPTRLRLFAAAWAAAVEPLHTPSMYACQASCSQVAADAMQCSHLTCK